MWRKAAGLCVGLVLAAAAGRPALAACQMKMFAEFPLEPSRYRALIKGAINGHPALFIADTGAFGSSIPYEEALRMGATPEQLPGVQVTGIGGRTRSGDARFDIQLGAQVLKGEVMMVLGAHALDHGVSALIGRNIIAQHDYELDLPDHAIRLIKVEGCPAERLAYWNKPYSQVALQGDGSDRPQILLNVMLNGHLVPALLDSGSPFSTVTPEAAQAAGMRFADAKAAGTIGGIGAGRMEERVATFDSFSIGDETIHNASIRIADMWKYNTQSQTGTRLGDFSKQLSPKMLLGADFLMSHRVLVANSLHVMVFSYLGGPVFSLPDPAPHAVQAPAGSQPAAKP